MSSDGTRKVINEFQEAHPDLLIRVLDNPARNIPHALNLGIAAARGEIIARMDAHAVPSAGYVRRCVAVLEEGSAGIVGMPCRVRPAENTVTARAIALGVSHPFGIGDAKYRLTTAGETQEDVDTVAFACFRKSLWSALSGFDEKLLTNEDYDFNYRARARGSRVVLDRLAHCDYFARPTLGKLASQYSRYGAWKARDSRATTLGESTSARRTNVCAFNSSALPHRVLEQRCLVALALEVYLFFSGCGVCVSSRAQGSGKVVSNVDAAARVSNDSFIVGTSFFVGSPYDQGRKGERTNELSVFGIGYVGCVSAACFAKAGHDVIGVDLNQTKVAIINSGKSPIVEAGIDELISDMVAAKRLRAITCSCEAIANSEISLVCVGTPSNANGSLDLDHVKHVCEEIGAALKNKTDRHTIVIRSTMLPGTIESLVVPTLEASSGKKAGADFGVCINPEFLREGSSLKDLCPPFTSSARMKRNCESRT